MNVGESALGSARRHAVPAASDARLTVPDGIMRRLDQAVTRGQHAATRFGGPDRAIARFAVAHLAPPPDAAGTKRELARMHRVADARTEPGIKRSKYLSMKGMTTAWEPYMGELRKRLGPDQATAGVELVERAMHKSEYAAHKGKKRFSRPRPYDADPTLEPVVRRPGGTKSYPSGHTSGAFAAALTLSHLMPDLRDELMGLANEVAWSRVYGGVHFPSDVIAGAQLAGTVSAALIGLSSFKIAA